jgi:hypothetical protein
VVIAGVHHQAAVEKSPREIVNCILFALDSATDNFCIVVIVKDSSQGGLDRKRFIQELDKQVTKYEWWTSLALHLLTKGTFL